MNALDYNASNYILCSVKKNFIYYDIYNAVAGELIQTVPFYEYHRDES